eukprot:Hpha_TRINITY_DN16262_c3_g7::TRINITY_DN16262_c3_g7_i1::g.15558::m.15558
MMKVLSVVLLVAAFATPAQSVTCEQCGYATCKLSGTADLLDLAPIDSGSSGSAPVEGGGNQTCGDSCSECNIFNCCLAEGCYFDDTDKTRVSPADCPNGCCWGDRCGTSDECSTAAGILAVLSVAACCLCCVAVPFGAAYWFGYLCFRRQTSSYTTIVQHPSPTSYPAYPQPHTGAYQTYAPPPAPYTSYTVVGQPAESKAAPLFYAQ